MEGIRANGAVLTGGHTGACGPAIHWAPQARGSWHGNPDLSNPISPHTFISSWDLPTENMAGSTADLHATRPGHSPRMQKVAAKASTQDSLQGRP